MFAIYKALTAVKLAEEATAAGVDAVPVFWLATYDHDLAEVNHVSIPGPDGAPNVLATPSHDVPGAPVSAVRLGDEIIPLVEQATKLLGDSAAAQFLRDCYRPGETLGTAFARLYARIFAEWGVIILMPPTANSTASPSPFFALPSNAPKNWMPPCWSEEKPLRPPVITSKLRLRRHPYCFLPCGRAPALPFNSARTEPTGNS